MLRCGDPNTGATTPATSPPSRSSPTTRRPNRNRPPPAVRRTLPARQLLTKHKRALRGRNPPRDSQNQRRPQESENKSGGMARANARPCPLQLFTGCAADLREPSVMPPKSWGLGQRTARRQTLTPARCGTFRNPAIPATRKHDHNSDNHPKSPDLKVVNPYDINSVRNT